jgi:hypothetical protein
MHDLFWARKELATLDPVRDARRYAQLTFENRYGLPIFIHALFSAAFAYNMGDPRIANVLYREGTGTIIKNTRQRNFETLVFFGLIYEHGDSPEGQRIIDRMQKIHSHFRIPNELYLYTLSTLAVLPRRISDRFAGDQGISRAELESQFQLWLRVGRMMGIQDIPPTQDEYLAWMLDYEKKNFRYTPGAEAVVKALAAEWAEYWFPKPLQGWAEGLFYALVDPELHGVLGVPRPTRLQSLAAEGAVKAFIRAVKLLPDMPERSLVKTFSQHIDGMKLKAKLA